MNSDWIEVSARASYDRARQLGRRLIQAETCIARSAEWSYEYARNVLQGRFPAGEATIAQSAEYSFKYAEFVLEGRFPAGEKAICSDYWWMKSYHDFLASIILPTPKTASSLPHMMISAPRKSFSYFESSTTKKHVSSHLTQAKKGRITESEKEVRKPLAEPITNPTPIQPKKRRIILD